MSSQVRGNAHGPVLPTRVARTRHGCPFHREGDEADDADHHMQQGPNTWQAEWLDGTAAAWSREAVGARGDNLTHQAWNIPSRPRVEHVLYAERTQPMQATR